MGQDDEKRGWCPRGRRHIDIVGTTAESPQPSNEGFDPWGSRGSVYALHLRRHAIKLMGRAHKAVYRLSGGRWLGTVAGMPVLLLTTTGRHSGRARTTPLTYFEDGDDLVVIASNGGEDAPPGWWLNLCSDAGATVTLGRDLRPVQAREAAAGERARLWPWITSVHPGYTRYAARTTRPIPIVILTGTKENAPGR